MRDRPLSCCDEVPYIDFSKMELPELMVDWNDVNLWVAAGWIVLNPLYWNVMARLEHRTRLLTKCFRSAYVGCTMLALSIFMMGLYRDWRFGLALKGQPRWWYMRQNWILWSGYGFMLIGLLLVVTSFRALGFTGTFLGDYFGILLPAPVTSFPYNIMSNPMYWGSTLNFLGVAMVHASQAGLVLSILVAIMYKVAIMLEGPFTEQIYEEHAGLNEKKAS